MDWGLVKWAIQLVQRLSHEDGSKLVAFLIVPALALLSCAAVEHYYGPVSDFRQSFAAVPLYANIDENGQLSDYQGIAVLVEPTGAQFNLPLTRRRGGHVLLSVTRNEFEANRHNLSVGRTSIGVTTPLLGISRPVIVIAEGKAGQDLLIQGGTVPLDQLALASRQSVSLLTWGLLASIFGLGVGFASVGVPVALLSSPAE
jgi:hypothetical protein